MKRVFILNGHPGKSSLSKTFSEIYQKASIKAGNETRIMHLSDLEFDMDFEGPGYRNIKPLEPDLKEVLDSLKWCDHLVMTSPMWWGGFPAKMKGLIDRVFLPGEVFDTRETRMGMPKPMLTGRSARVIVTSDTPSLFMRFYYKNAFFRQIRNHILAFVGIKPAKITHFSGASHSKDEKIKRWMKIVEKLALKGD